MMQEIRPEDIRILIIDDESAIRDSFSEYLEDEGYQVQTAADGDQGLKLIESNPPDMVLTDLRMPHTDGLEVLKRGKDITRNIPFIVISGTGEISDIVGAIRAGAWDYITKPLNDLGFLKHQVEKNLEKSWLKKENERYKNHLEFLVKQRTKELEQRNRQLELSRRQIIGILSQAAEYRDFETGQHFMRVSSICSIIAKGLQWNEEQIQNLELAAPVHDIGKIGIPDHILLKPGKLNKEEWKIMKSHCQIGQHILLDGKKRLFNSHLDDRDSEETLDSPVLDMAADICLYHHEYWDGSGYPIGLKGEEIPLTARITTLADVFDSLMSKRPYKEPWPDAKVLNHIEKGSGKLFDPLVVETFMSNLERIKKIRDTYKDDRGSYI